MTTDVQPATWAADSRPPVYLAVILLAIPVVAVLAFVIFQPIQVLPRIGLAPGYSFTDQNGEPLTSEDLRGGLTLYTFTYTRCEAPCRQPAVILREMEQALADVETGSIPVNYVAISFDPDYDTPERLRAFAAELGVDSDRWRFVTGQPAQLKNVIGAGFGVYYNRNDDGSYTFDPVFALVDGWGILRAVYRTPAPDLEILKRDVGLIVREVQNSRGINRYAYEAAHLFLCYPR